MEKSRPYVLLVSIINAWMLFPCAIITFCKLFQIDTYAIYWNHLWGLAAMPAALSGILCIPIIVCAAVLIYTVISFIKAGIRAKACVYQLVGLILSTGFSIFGLLSLQEVIQAVMSV